MTVQNKEEFLEQSTIMFDLYVENYFNNNLSLTENDHQRLLSVMTTKYNEFTVKYLEENPTGPYDLAKVSEIFTRQMDEAIKTNQAALNAVNSQMNNYTDKLNENKSNMLTLAYTANENDYVTEAEWTKVKNNMINSQR